VGVKEGYIVGDEFGLVDGDIIGEEVVGLLVGENVNVCTSPSSGPSLAS